MFSVHGGDRQLLRAVFIFFDMVAIQELMGFLFSIFRCGYCILTATCGKPRTFAVNFI
jgi:hypothetical protein